MESFKIEDRDRVTVMVHYYRAMVTRADVWRNRMDATTNWAVGTSAAVLSFSLGNPDTPHYIVLIASLLCMGFLQLESRRVRFYHMWQHRVLLLEQGMVRPALNRSLEPDPAWVGELTSHLGTTVPMMPPLKAVARRLRRIYLWLFSVQLMAWLFKLVQHPTRVERVEVIIDRAQIGGVPGALALALTIGLFVASVLVAIVAGRVGSSSSPSMQE